METLNTTDLLDSGKEILEVILDKKLADGVLKDVPIINTLIGIYRLGDSVSDRLLAKRISKFIFELNSVSDEDVKKFIKIYSSGNKVEKLGERILEILDKLNDSDKASVIGKLFKAKILGNIVTDDFLRLSYIVDSCYLVDIKQLHMDPSLALIPKDILINLAKIGLLNQEIENRDKYKEHIERNGISSKGINSKFKYRINSYGTMILKYGF